MAIRDVGGLEVLINLLETSDVRCQVLCTETAGLIEPKRSSLPIDRLFEDSPRRFSQLLNSDIYCRLGR